MIDREDRDDHETGDDSSSTDVAEAPQDTAREQQRDGDEATETGDAPPAEEPETAEDQPAMTLEDESDEGGTVEREAPGHDEPVEGAPADEAHEDAATSDTEDDVYSDPDEGEDLDFRNEDLGLVTDEEALPWLESSDYEEVETVDAWRITGFVVMGLVVLALIVGGIWYFNQRGQEDAMVADGSTIAAPEGPYKERPEDPGGKTFEGTGDMAPAVGEGEAREGRLAEGSATPEPVARETPSPTPEPTSTRTAASDERIVVQVGAYRDEATAEAGWAQLQRQTDALSGVRYRIVRGEADIGTVYRLQALPGDMAAARRLRDALQADGVASQIKQ